MTDGKVTRMTGRYYIKAHEFMKTVCRTVGGYAVYEKGWDDERVLAHLAVHDAAFKTITLNSINYMRREVFGRFAPRAPDGTFDLFGADVRATLERQDVFNTQVLAILFELCDKTGVLRPRLDKPDLTEDAK